MNDLAYYLSKIPPLNAGKPKFTATLSLTLQPLVDMQAFLAGLPEAFDLDNAIGVQLDICGQWIGRKRTIPLPLQTLFFSLGDPLRGLGRGYWKNSYNPGDMYEKLDDEIYRRLLKAVAIVNRWDGTVVMGQQVLDAFFPPGQGTYTFIQDDGWGVQTGNRITSSMTIGVSGKIPGMVDIQILAQDLLGLKPASIPVNYAITSVDGAPIFGLGLDNDYIGGLGRGALAVSPQVIAYNDPDLLAKGYIQNG